MLGINHLSHPKFRSCTLIQIVHEWNLTFVVFLKQNKIYSHKNKIAMKTTVKTFICAFALAAASFTAQAGDKEAKKVSSFGTGIYATKAGKINVLVDKGSTDSKTTLLLRDAEGTVVYRETVSRDHKKFGRTLNLDAMEPGKYKLDIIAGNEVQSKTFELTDQKVERILTVN
jgi:hypothetical protein